MIQVVLGIALLIFWALANPDIVSWAISPGASLLAELGFQVLTRGFVKIIGSEDRTRVNISYPLYWRQAWFGSTMLGAGSSKGNRAMDLPLS